MSEENMGSVPEFEIAYVDSKRNMIAQLKGPDFVEQLDKLKIAIENMVQKMEKIDKYELSQITAKVGLELGYLVFKADGSIEMTWKKPEKRKGR